MTFELEYSSTFSASILNIIVSNLLGQMMIKKFLNIYNHRDMSYIARKSFIKYTQT
jgi:hypothetical protein